MSISDPIKPGDEILASTWEAIRRVAAKFGKFTVAYPLELIQTSGGTSLRMREREEFFGKILSGGANGLYAWTELVAVAGGNWQTGKRSGSSAKLPAHEVNGNTGVAAGTIVYLRRDDSEQQYRFVYSRCG